MHWLALIFICGTLVPFSSAEDTSFGSQGSSDEKSPLSPEILVLDNVIKRLKDQKEGLSFKNYERARIDQIIPDSIFSLDENQRQPSRNSSTPQARRRRQVLSGCGYYPCPPQPAPCPYGQLCPYPPVPYPAPPPYVPVPPPAPPPTFIPPPYQPPQPPTPSYYIPTFPPPAPPQPTYIPQPPAPYPRPTFPPRPHPTYIPQPPAPYPRPTFPPRPQPTYIPQPPAPYPRPTYPPRPPPAPEPSCPPVNPNIPDKLENLKIFLSQAGNCKNTGCSNRCMRPRKEKCTIDYDTLLMRLAFIEEKLRDLEKIEARLKISIVILQSIKKDPRFPGSPGETGAPGVKGARGSKGPTGYPGVNGICVTRASQNPSPGPRGPPGNKGDQGYPGDKLCNCDGERGDDGDPGDSLTGLPGARGVKGAKGERGPIIHYRKTQ